MKISYRFSSYLLTLLQRLYGETCEAVFRSLQRPSPRYFIRVNTLKSSKKDVINSFNSHGIKTHSFPMLDEAIYLNVEGPFNIPLFPKRVVVDKFAAEAVLQGAHVYAPGIMKCQKIRKGDKVTITNKMEMPVASGTTVMGETEILTLRKGLAINITHSPYNIPSLMETSEYNWGSIYPQSLPALITVRNLDPKEGDIIADLNCAPGGKVSHICQLTENKSTIYAMDRNFRKIQITQQTLLRLGCENVKLLVQDTRYTHLDHPNLTVDKCIVDPPCSALGVTPKTYDHTDYPKVKALANYQKQFIKAASMITKSDGVIIYSVCTITPEECEEIVKYAMKECGLELTPQSYIVGEQGFPDYIETPEYLQRFHPHIHGIGYFIAKFKKM